MRTGAWISELGSQHPFVVEVAPSVGEAWSAEHLFPKRGYFSIRFSKKKYYCYSVLKIVLYFLSLKMYMMT